MPNTRVNRESLNNHYHYHKWIYALILIGAWFVIDMAFTMTEYHPPAEKKIDIYCVGPYMDVDAFDALARAMLPDYPQLEAINFYTIAFSSPDDIYGTQKFSVMLGAQEGDLMFMSTAAFKQIADGGGAMPLDDYIASSAIDLNGIDVRTTTFAASPEFVDDPVPHTYGIPIASLTKLMDDPLLYDVRDQVAVLMAYSQNPDNAALVLSNLISAMKPE